MSHSQISSQPNPILSQVRSVEAPVYSALKLSSKTMAQPVRVNKEEEEAKKRVFYSFILKMLFLKEYDIAYHLIEESFFFFFKFQKYVFELNLETICQDKSCTEEFNFDSLSLDDRDLLINKFFLICLKKIEEQYKDTTMIRDFFDLIEKKTDSSKLYLAF